MKIIPLGTKAGGSAHLHRYPSSYYFAYESENCLIDAGEGAQFQLLRAGLSSHALKNIFITHLHGDHVLGLMGILSNLSSEHRVKPLQVFGPKGLQEMLEVLSRLTHVEFRYECTITELEDSFSGVVYSSNSIHVVAQPMEHRVSCFGYRINENQHENIDTDKATALGITQPEQFKQLKDTRRCNVGDTIVTMEDILAPAVQPRSVTFCGDTRPCDNVVALASHTDVMIYESTFAQDLEEKAQQRYHSTSVQAAEVAKKANVGSLYLTHFSNRYEDVTPLLTEAQSIFPETFLCKELQEIIINKKG